jgi:hypothetical protein
MEMKTQTRRLNIAWYLAAATLLLAGAATVRAEASPESRINVTSEGQGILRTTDRVISHDELEPLKINGIRSKSTRGSAQQALSVGGSGTSAQTPNVEFWIFDATVELFSDLDRDNFYSGIKLNFDADTVYNDADVYAVLYLSYELGPWNEYASTADFSIFGASGGDEYFVETELVSGYLTGEYDILIELFDAYDGTFVASFGPDESSSLAYLPLEDVNRDTPPGTTVIINEGGGGALGLLGLLALFGVAGLARTRTSGA